MQSQNIKKAEAIKYLSLLPPIQVLVPERRLCWVSTTLLTFSRSPGVEHTHLLPHPDAGWRVACQAGGWTGDVIHSLGTGYN